MSPDAAGGAPPPAEALHPLKSTRPNLSAYNWFQLVFPGLVLIPFRIAVVLLGLCFMAVLSNLCILVSGNDALAARGLTGFPKFLRDAVRGLLRAVLFCLGIVWIKETGSYAGRENAAIVVANHVTWLDFMVLSWVQYGFPVSRVENLGVPFFGAMTRVSQAILVDRKNTSSRAGTVVLITQRGANAAAWPDPVTLFPEGTCHNQTCLMQWQTGAFRNALPVQPAAIRYTTRHHDISWTWGSGGMTWLVMFAQWVIPVEVQWCDVVAPDEGGGDPIARAEAARGKVAAALGIPTTEYNHHDTFLQQIAKQRGEGARLPEYAIESGRLRAAYPAVSEKDVARILRAFLAAKAHAQGAGGFTFAAYAACVALPKDLLLALCEQLDTTPETAHTFRGLAYLVTARLARLGPPAPSPYETAPFYAAAVAAEGAPAPGAGVGNPAKVAPAPQAPASPASPGQPTDPSTSVILRLLPFEPA